MCGITSILRPVCSDPWVVLIPRFHCIDLIVVVHMYLAELDTATEDSFIQEYVDNPLLIDGRRFDIGVYTTLTSVSPLRVYVHEGDWLVR